LEAGELYQLWFVVPQKSKNHTMVNADPPVLVADVGQAGIEIMQQVMVRNLKGFYPISA
jgi:hypothetical protein